MRQFCSLVVSVWVFALGMGVSAEPVDSAVSNVILGKLQVARPDLAYGEVQETPMEGLYQVKVQNGPVLYVSATGDFMLAGTLYGVSSTGFVDLQELAMLPVRKSKLDAIAASDEIIFPAKGERKAYIYVFTDVDCGYCRKLHKEVPAMNEMGIEVRYLAYPRAGIGSPSYTKIAEAWCAKDPQTALTRLKNGQSVDAKYCEDNPVAEQFNLGGELGVRGTPAIVLADGTMLPGYVEASKLAQILGL
ncbi:DsbC family protein [Aestuariicella hydrocarbonica]|uniref:Thiol:disulfide interchange protein n=1 Tax=Pseudomaricurvus hydrocarbonicus TaxID=1470433 RepID=A0A9E5MLS4_9GAMM|nr:DsbC family protein [Aestuariicella hydrocarbonica]NHO64520.1 DsbC family protein [Aestuariicella hydrocarbonica]